MTLLFTTLLFSGLTGACNVSGRVIERSHGRYEKNQQRQEKRQQKLTQDYNQINQRYSKCKAAVLGLSNQIVSNLKSKEFNSIKEEIRSGLVGLALSNNLLERESLSNFDLAAIVDQSEGVAAIILGAIAQYSLEERLAEIRMLAEILANCRNEETETEKADSSQ